MTWRIPCAGLRLTAILALWIAGSPVMAAPARWSLILSGQDVTSLAAFRENGGVLEVNVPALAPMLNLRVALAGNSVTFTSASGKWWSAMAGEFALAGDSGRVQLSAPLRLEGAAVFLPGGSAVPDR